MTLAQQAEVLLKAGKGDNAPFAHLSAEGAAICRAVEERLETLSRRVNRVEKLVQEDCA